MKEQVTSRPFLKILISGFIYLILCAVLPSRDWVFNFTLFTWHFAEHMEWPNFCYDMLVHGTPLMAFWWCMLVYKAEKSDSFIATSALRMIVAFTGDWIYILAKIIINDNEYDPIGVYTQDAIILSYIYWPSIKKHIQWLRTA